MEDMEAFFDHVGFQILGTAESPILGPEGNREFFIYARRRQASPS
jgi:23S rRNA (cytidine1920-2'-O)/16S rRNA (cytidine1409-2'-O)-methyltransferase